jgi:hypothetical protein
VIVHVTVSNGFEQEPFGTRAAGGVAKP